MKNSGKLGKISSVCEVANISPFGVWILLGRSEYFLDHKRYPWFKNAAVSDVLDVECPRSGHLRWPKLDIDLHLDAIEHPERYPLVAKQVTQAKSVHRPKKLRRSH
jgi:hypothetical protein